MHSCAMALPMRTSPWHGCQVLLRFPWQQSAWRKAANDAVITLGAVIRGATSHYDFVCSEVSKGVANVALGADIPVMFGVLTTDTIEQAIERAGTKAGNKGAECAQGAIEMVNLLREMA